MDGISRSRGWDKEIPHGVLPMEQLVLSDKWARILIPVFEKNYPNKNLLLQICPATSPHSKFATIA